MPVLWGTSVWGGFIWGSDDPPAPEGFTDGQVQLGDLTLGAGTEYALEDWNPWGAADVRADDRVRSQSWGLFPAEGQFGGRRLEFSLHVLADTRNDALDAMQVLSAAFKPTGDIVALIWREGGLTYRLHGQTRGVTPDTRYSNQGVIRCVVRFVATDPNVLSDTGRSITITAESKATVAVPLAVPLAWTTPTGGTGTVTNDGSGDTHWRASISGPCQDPRIENVTTGQVLRFRGRINSGDSLLLDSELRSRVMDGSSIVSPRSLPWWKFPPGSTPVRFTAEGGGSLLVSWRDAWTP